MIVPLNVIKRPVRIGEYNISVCQQNHLITQGNHKTTCFDYRLVIFRPILSIVSQDTIHTLGSHRVYIRGIHQIKSFVSKGVTCKFARHALRDKRLI
jgi:hypothetical protein